MSEPNPPSIARLRPALAATARRVRAQRAIDAALVLAWVGVGMAGLLVALLKTGGLAEADAVTGLWIAAALPVLAGLVGALRPVAPLLPARLLDRSHGLKERIANAVSFADADERTPLMDAAIRDALSQADELEPKRAMPLAVSIDAVGIAGLGIGVLLMAYVEVPRTVTERILTGGITPVQLHADDLDAYESDLERLLEDRDTSEEVRDAAREFNSIIEDLADERLDRAESLRRIAELERRLEQTNPADAELMRESLQELGEDMRRSNLADELSAALRDGDASTAESQMRQLAERVRQDEGSRRELERLREAMRRAAQEREDELSDRLEQREEEMRRLLQRQREQQEQPEAERRLLRRRQRELERLRREHQEAMERRRQLERLRRELNEAVEDLNRQQREQAAQDMEQAAEELNRMAQQQMSQEEMQQLARQLRELRELIRRARQQQAQNGQQGQGQQGQRGQGQGQSQMDRFVLRARGQGGQGVRIQGPGQQGQGQQGQGQQGQGQQGQAGQGQDGQGQGGQGENGERVLTLGGEGEANATLEIPGMGQGQQQGQGMGQGQMSPGAGTGHDPTLLDDPTRLGGTRRTVRVEGEQSEGPSRSQTIMSSAERGFASRAYEDVYTDYSDHAEEVLERDEIPPGRRFWIRRYFQLIRPRGD